MCVCDCAVCVCVCVLTDEHREEEDRHGDVEDRTGDVKEPVWSHGEETKEKEEKEQTAAILLHLFRGVEGKRWGAKRKRGGGK